MAPGGQVEIVYSNFATLESPGTAACTAYLRLTAPVDSTTGSPMTSVGCPDAGGGSIFFSPCTHHSPLGTLVDTPGRHASGCSLTHSLVHPEYNMQKSVFTAAADATGGTITYRVQGVEQEADVFSNGATVIITIAANHPPVALDKTVVAAPHEVVALGDPSILAGIKGASRPKVDRFEPFSGFDPDGDPFGFVVSESLTAAPDEAKITVVCAEKPGNNGAFKDCVILFEAKNKPFEMTFGITATDGAANSVSPAAGIFKVQDKLDCTCKAQTGAFNGDQIKRKGEYVLGPGKTLKCLHIAGSNVGSANCTSDPATSKEKYTCLGIVGITVEMTEPGASLMVSGEALVKIKGEKNAVKASFTNDLQGKLNLYSLLPESASPTDCGEAKVIDLAEGANLQFETDKDAPASVKKAFLTWVRVQGLTGWKDKFTRDKKPISVDEVEAFTKLTIVATGKPIAKVFAFSACGGDKKGSVKSTQEIGMPQDPDKPRDPKAGRVRDIGLEEVEEDKCKK